MANRLGMSDKEFAERVEDMNEPGLAAPQAGPLARRQGESFSSGLREAIEGISRASPVFDALIPKGKP